MQDERPPRVARSLYKRIAIAAAVIVAGSAATVATAGFKEVDHICELACDKPGGIGRIHLPPSKGPQTLLLLGSDRRYSDIKAKIPPRSDTIILIRLDPSKKATTVMSIPRDLKVAIPGHRPDKVNAAYAEGGPALSLRTLRGLLAPQSPTGQFVVNHIVNINFGGFRRAVDKLGCIYADVDHRYFNDNNPPVESPTDYATIDIDAGYQKLCGQNALDFVRYRHLDSDLVRAARQQDFLRQAKNQIGIGQLFAKRDELLKIFGRYTQTDISDSTAILRLLRLVVESAGHPVQQVQFPADQDGDYLTITPAKLRKTVGQFLDPQGTTAPRPKPKRSATDKKRARRQKRKATSAVPLGLFANKMAGENMGIRFGAKLPFPVYYPTLGVIGSSYDAVASRIYTIPDRGGTRHAAYRMVADAPGLGQYYGIEGTTWKTPPILDNPSETRRVGGKSFQLYFDSDRLRLVAWKTPRAAYWIANTLQESLTNKQMLGLARSFTRVGQ